MFTLPVYKDHLSSEHDLSVPMVVSAGRFHCIGILVPFTSTTNLPIIFAYIPCLYITYYYLLTYKSSKSISSRLPIQP